MGSRHFVLVDAGFNDLMRPAMYGSYHHISALAADGRFRNTRQRWKPSSPDRYVNRAMSLPSRKGNVETRALPEVKAGDCLVLHDTGAYGASMLIQLQ